MQSASVWLSKKVKSSIMLGELYVFGLPHISGAPKVLFVVGASPPDPCGIGDYCHQLGIALHARGVNVDFLIIRKATLFGWLRAMFAINLSRADVVHLQYPGLGFGLGKRASLLPQFISVLAGGVVTLHEYSQVHWLRRLASSVFAISAHHLVFTNRWERQQFSAYYNCRAHSSIVPIGSNIRASQRLETGRVNRIVHFGLIRPRRGLKDVIALGKILAVAQSHLHIEIVGSPYPGEECYYRGLLEQSAGLPIKWVGAMTSEALAEYFASTAYAYMPFPDGASERRTSLLALMANGVVTVTRRGQFTPDDWGRGLLFASSPIEAHIILGRVHSDANQLSSLRLSLRSLAKNYNWDGIAAQHCLIYGRMGKRLLSLNFMEILLIA